jgi:hypothetical protein
MDANIVSTSKLSQRISYWSESGNPAHLLAALDEACMLIDSLAKRYRELEARLNDADAHSALMQHGMEFMGSELSTVQALRDTLNAVFTIEAPVCARCNGTGYDVYHLRCTDCGGKRTVQS